VVELLRVVFFFFATHLFIHEEQKIHEKDCTGTFEIPVIL